MKVLWICGLPNEVRLNGWRHVLSPIATPAWSWILGHLPPPDDVELHIVCPVSGLVANRIDFDYLGAHWHCFRRKSFKHAFAYLWHHFVLRRFIKGLRSDVVHGWGGETGYGYLATKYSKRSVVSVQGLLLLLYKVSSESFEREMGSAYGRFMIWREKRTYSRATRLLTESEFSRAALKEHYGPDSIVIPHPLRTAFLTHEAAEIRVRTPQFVFVGSLVKRKGAVDVVRAFAQCPCLDARLVMIGAGPEKTLIEAIIRENGIVNRVELKGICSQQEIATIMRQSQFFSLPTYSDTGPTALKEALACGLFPICYDNSGPHEYLNRYCGYLVPTGDIIAYSAAMEDAVANLGDCVKKAEIAAKSIRSDLAKEAVWVRLMSVYEEIAWE